MGGGGGMSLSFGSCLDWSVKSERSTLRSALTASGFEVFWALSQCKSDITLRSSPKDAVTLTTGAPVKLGRW